MFNILVLYYSRSGNTEKMATAVTEGARSIDNSNVELSYHVEAEDLGRFDAIIFGVPTYNHAIPFETEKLLEAAAEWGISFKEKIGAAFGSYGWSGEAPKLLLEIMKNKFEMNIIAPPLLAKYIPDNLMIHKCQNLGRIVAKALVAQL